MCGTWLGQLDLINEEHTTQSLRHDGVTCFQMALSYATFCWVEYIYITKYIIYNCIYIYIYLRTYMHTTIIIYIYVAENDMIIIDHHNNHTSSHISLSLSIYMYVYDHLYHSVNKKHHTTSFQKSCPPYSRFGFV